jgi:hypothetical protein
LTRLSTKTGGSDILQAATNLGEIAAAKQKRVQPGKEWTHNQQRMGAKNNPLGRTNKIGPCTINREWGNPTGH